MHLHIISLLNLQLRNRQKQRKLKQMAKNYQKYARQFNYAKFSELEEGLLSE